MTSPPAARRPAPWKLSAIPTLWLDVETGSGVDDAGRAVQPLIGGRRQKPALVDLLDTAAHHGAARLMLSGRFPPVGANRPHWLLVATEGWLGAGHYIKDDRPPTGRFVRTGDRTQVQVRVAREWFGTDAISPATAREAMSLTQISLSKALPGELGYSPAGAGQNIWAASLPRDFAAPEVSEEVSELIRSTSGQHRTEHLVEGRSRCDCGDCLPLIGAKAAVPGFCYVDGRFMYAALCREVGVGGRMLTKAEAQSWADTPYARARYKVRFTVPDQWDTLGILGVYRADARHWHWPNRPGATYETWVDAVELATARAWWPGATEVLEGIGFDKGRPLDNFAGRLVKAWADAATLNADAHLIDAVTGALRSVLLQTIGAFHSQGRDRTVTVASTFDVPPDLAGTIRSYGDVITYLEPSQPNERLATFYHPEYSAQVWARERARILLGPTAPYTDRNGKQWSQWGALEAHPATLIGVNGDALYLTGVPEACLPTEAQGGDDGRVGRLRVKGWIGEPMPAPPTTEARNALRGRAEAMGVPPELLRRSV